MRFYFDLNDGGTITHDDVGMECSNLDAARIEAIVALTEMARDWLPHDGNNRDLLTVVREGNKPLMQVSFRFEVQSLDPRLAGDDKVLAVDHRRS